MRTREEIQRTAKALAEATTREWSWPAFCLLQLEVLLDIRDLLKPTPDPYKVKHPASAEPPEVR